jgi:hypothetical protein
VTRKIIEEKKGRMKFTGLLTAAALLGSASAFSANKNVRKGVQASEATRRSFIGGAAALIGASLLPQSASAALGRIPKDSVIQKEMNSFSDLIYMFKDVTLNGLDASKLNEPSVPFIEFGERMKKGEVEFVEFIAPSGNVAYATFKPQKGGKESSEKIRIGEGYPTVSKDSWTSPDYVIRSVSNFGVPYKFTVPALAKFNK